MFQWLVEVSIPGQRQLGSALVEEIRAFEPFGPAHPDDATAKTWIRKADLASSGPYRLAGPPVRTRTVVVLEGLDDGPAEAKASTEPPARRRRTKAEIEADTAAAQADPPEVRAAIRDAYLAPAGDTPAPPALELVIAAPADLAPVDDDETDYNADDACTDERGPLPPALAASGMAEAMGIVPSTAAATGPSVDVRGVLVELFDGSAWHWQKFQTPTTAERTAKKAQEAIDCNDPVEMAKQLRGIVTMLKRGRIPATEG